MFLRGLKALLAGGLLVVAPVSSCGSSDRSETKPVVVAGVDSHELVDEARRCAHLEPVLFLEQLSSTSSTESTLAFLLATTDRLAFVSTRPTEKASGYG